MKNCTYCNAALPDNAKFCINCMMPLEKKPKIKVRPFAINKKLFLTATTTFLIGVLTALSVFVTLNTSQKQSTSNFTPQDFAFDDALNQSTENEIISVEDSPSSYISSQIISNNPSIPENSSHDTASKPDDSSDNVSSTPSATDNSSTTQSNNTPTTSTNSSNNNNSENEQKPITSSDDDTPSGEEPKAEEQALKFHFLYASTLPEYNILFDWYTREDLADKIIITAVEGEAPNGICNIPEKIDGFTVIGISNFSFDSAKNPTLNIMASTIKKIIFPKSVTVFDPETFHFCTNLTDAYICAESVYLPSYTFSLNSTEGTDPKINLYCSKSCENISPYFPKLLKDSIPYGCVYAEWDGTLPK